DAAMEEIAPDAIDQPPCEKRVLGSGEPAGVRLTTIAPRGNLRLDAAKEPRPLGLPGAGMSGRARRQVDLHDFPVGDRRKARILPRAHLAEEARQPVVVGLRPVLERVGMAAGTQHPHAAEDLRSPLDSVVGVLADREVNAGRVIYRSAARCKSPPRE